MLCCKECTLETDTTFTTVLFIDQLTQQRTHALQNYAQKYLKKMQAKKHTNQRHIQQASFGEGKCNKENRESMGNVRHRERKSIKSIKDIQSHMMQIKDSDCQTGRFNASSRQTHPSRQSFHCKKQLQSKTTSFGSLASRTSLAKDLLSRAELNSLQQQLQNLKEEETSLIRQKMHRQCTYKKQYSKINQMKEELSSKSRKRHDELHQLRLLFTKKRYSQCE